MTNDATRDSRREARRKLHREVVARSRVRQRERVAVLTKQETALQAQLTRLLRASQSTDDEYTTLVATQETLRRENDALEDRVHRHYLFSRFVQFERGYVLEDDATTSETTTDDSVWLDAVNGGRRLHYVLDPEAPALVAECFRQTNDLENMFHASSELKLDVAHVLGWRAERAIHWHARLEKKLLYFRFSRTVLSTQATLRETQETSWRVLSSPTTQTRLYSVPVTIQPVQAIDDDAQIVYQHKAYHVPLAFFCLNAQRCEPGVVRQSMMVLDKPPPPQYDATNNVWLREGIICLTFRDDPVRGTVDVEFAGCMRCVDERHAQFMLIDVGCVLVRWENLVLPTRLLL